MEERLMEKELEMKNAMNTMESEFERLSRQKDEEIVGLQMENDRMMKEIRELEGNKGNLEERIIQMEKDILQERGMKEERKGMGKERNGRDDGEKDSKDQ